MPNQVILNIIPDVTLLAKLGRSNFTIPYALGEFIDNSYDARGQFEPILINIDFDLGKSSITITDTGEGMDEKELETALKIGLSGKRKDSIGQYGLGLKAAAAFLSRRFTIETTKLNSNQGLIAVWDQEQFEISQKWELSATVIPKSENEHGTKITLEDLNVDLQFTRTSDISLSFARVYHKLLEADKLRIVLNDEPILPIHCKLVEGLKWEINLLVNGKVVKGWVGAKIPEKLYPDNKSFESGFELIRHGRVLKFGEWIGIEKHGAVRTLVGELELDDFDVNNNKTDFLRDTPDWVQLDQALKTFFANNNIRQKIYKGTTVSGGSSTGKLLESKTQPPEAVTTQLFDYQKPPTEISPVQIKPPSPVRIEAKPQTEVATKKDKKKVFVVHGLNEVHLKECYELMESFEELEPIVLKYQPNIGRTIIEKFEVSAKECQYAVILLTPDDMAYSTYKNEGPEHAVPRARQNVIFEFGYFIGRITRKKTACLYKDVCNIELPTDLQGLVYIPFKNSVDEVKEDLRKELIQAGVLKPI